MALKSIRSDTFFFSISLRYLFFSTNFGTTFRSDMVSLESLIARIMLLKKFQTKIPDSILKPLWLLFAVSTYIILYSLSFTPIVFDFIGDVSLTVAQP